MPSDPLTGTFRQPLPELPMRLEKEVLRYLRCGVLAHAFAQLKCPDCKLAFSYNTVGIPLAAGVLYPFLGLLPIPTLARASVSVIATSLRLRKVSLSS